MTIDKEKLSSIDETYHQTIEKLYSSWEKKYQRKGVKDILLFLSCYSCLKENDVDISFKLLSEKLRLDPDVVTKAIKYNRKNQCCKIEDVSTKSIIKSTLGKFNITNVSIEDVEEEYNKIASTTDICIKYKPTNVVFSIVYYHLSKISTFDKMYYTDKLDMSIITLDKILKNLNEFFDF